MLFRPGVSCLVRIWAIRFTKGGREGGREGENKTYRANRSHGVVNSAGAKTALDDLEASSFAEDHIALVHSDIVERDVAMAVRGVVKAHDGKHAVDGDAWGVGGDEDD